MNTFFLVDFADVIHELRMETSLTIGRSPVNAILLDDCLVSREHARVTLTKKGPVLTDRKSSNGISVNGRRVEAQILKHGDSFQISKYIFFVFEGTRADVEAWVKKRAASRSNQTITQLTASHPLPTDLVGDLSTINLVALLQSLVEQRQRGCLELTQYGLLAGKIWVDNSQIVHAETAKPCEGTAALYELMELDYAQFAFRPETAVPRISIVGNPVAILLEGCRLLDERRHNANIAAKPS